ncbi:circularly permuted type 2 ATP-grasp protein [Varunaivibrio sulfuroxidans]|uniref:Putative circularly permuted ATP-grasp superfamily protein n=1 Tax=Varunaivibrio sulfuroxidans TaxID=1773489 RepID=A0A4R3JJS1_9PROT|nr:circularly permuted type 2 ATP-grasp protein [Varunaivibrio sulfuroxidans]TCS65140.1 putative circularly permuted ATP-grasp superfamily protein [Varunaivibrio sulfuroxidans]WES29575.1 circularly permuted type 2 ATP-grasp protein [Varunaivibrio sulfuroxidans]
MPSLSKLFAHYDPNGYYCELLGSPNAQKSHLPGRGPRTDEIARRLDKMNLKTLRRRALSAEKELFNLGITFTVYSENQSVDRILPFDVLPRILTPQDWSVIERGVRQRLRVLNMFLHDIYHDQRIIKDKIIPAELVLANANFRPEMVGVDVACDTYVHICGIDIVRDAAGRFKVLEDNTRVPSGVSYVIENRHLMLRAFPDLFEGVGVRPVSDYGLRLHRALSEAAPARHGGGEVSIVLMSPGIYNSAYFEHVFLAREMGVPLVEGRDLVVDDDTVFMKTANGLERVDVIYRRIGDDFIDPEVFNPASMLGVPGLMRAYRAGRVTLANAVGTGVADDKAVYAYMPRMIRYYLDEDPILDNVHTHICREAEGLAYTLDHIDELVVKPVGEAGGYGVLIGPNASKAEIAQRRAELKADPANYIAQPVIDLSVCPTLCDGGIEPRHVDLRPFAVTGKDTWVLPGGLTRVALTKGSLIVNSSQGGGSKDTWVLEQ